MGIDFIYYPLSHDESRGGDLPPGILVLGAPRGACRHRRNDLLAIYLQIEGEHRYTPNEINELVAEAAWQFFSIQGSVTRAMQAACDLINKHLLEYNLDSAYEGMQARGALGLAVLHAEWLFVGQLGQAAILKVSSERFDLFDVSPEASESLGQMKRVQLRFNQSKISSGDVIIICGRPLQTWTAVNLSGSGLLKPSALRRRLLSQAPAGLAAVVIRCESGGGQARLGSWAEEESPPAGEGEITAGPDEKDSLPVEVEPVGLPTQIDPADESAPAELLTAPGRTELPGAESDLPEEESEWGEEDIPIKTGETEQPISLSQRQAISQKPAGGNSVLVGIARAWMNAKTLIARLRLAGGKIQPRFLKNKQYSFTGGAPLLSLLMAIMLPVGVIITAVSVYTRTGKEEQFNMYFSQAQEAYALAEKETDGLQKHAYWGRTVDLVSQAEEFRITRESRLLFEQAQFKMDEMDLAARLEFRPALTSFLQPGVVVSRIRSSYSGLYLLDETSGSVLRLYLNAKGFYEIDQSFKCAPGPYGLVTVSKLVDFITLPANDDNYRVMAIDDQGNLLYCRSDQPPVSNTLTPPEKGWSKIVAVAYDQDILYVLDTENSAIWMYAGKNPQKLNVPGATGVFFVESPVQFLDEDIPDLRGGMDMAVNQQELYVLHADGHMTFCRYSPIKEVRLTECQDPASYTDNRIGRDNKKPWIFMDARFVMMQDIKVPTLSIFILDSSEPSIYQFSFQLNLERTLRIQQNKNYPVPSAEPSGFGVTPDMEIILAFDNRLYLAPMR